MVWCCGFVIVIVWLGFQVRKHLQIHFQTISTSATEQHNGPHQHCVCSFMANEWTMSLDMGSLSSSSHFRLSLGGPAMFRRWKLNMTILFSVIRFYFGYQNDSSLFPAAQCTENNEIEIWGICFCSRKSPHKMTANYCISSPCVANELSRVSTGLPWNDERKKERERGGELVYSWPVIA